MTTVDVTFHYSRPPEEGTLRAINAIREVYGIRRIAFKEAVSTVTVEYDATRMNPAVVRQLLRRAGLDAVESPASANLDAGLAEAPASAPALAK